MADIKEVAENIYQIDNQLYSAPEGGCVYLSNEQKKALIDTGPTTSAPAVLEGIGQLGLAPGDIDYLVATHIHLDHAGGAGFLLQSMPQAQVFVHYKGARHLVNPAKLVNSMVAVEGNEALIRSGEVVPVPAEHVKSVYDGALLKLGEKQTLTFIDSPGHATHHLCIHESRNNGIFTGDAAGMYFSGIVLPVTPPPSFDLEVSIDTINRLIKLEASRLYFAHFGTTTRVKETLQSTIDKLRLWGNILAEAVRNNKLDGSAEKIMAQLSSEVGAPGIPAPLYQQFLGVVNMSIPGYVNYFQKQNQSERAR